MRSLRDKKPLRIKLGLDPTAPHIHLGFAVVLRKLRQFQDFGHKVIILIGDFTARVGDPTGRSQTRKVLSIEQIQANAATYKNQLSAILDPERTEVRFNSEWLEKMNFNDVIALCSRYTVARIMERDDFTKRFTSGISIGVHEFLYPLMQGWDSVNLEADLEMGGTDQKFNNLVCTASITFCFYKELKEGFMGDFATWSETKRLIGKMLRYSWPILVLGIAGILNQTADKILFPYIYKGNDSHTQLGIYGAASKIAMIMAMITQAFRYAYEPFVFGKAKDKDSRDTYAAAMKYFLIFTLLAFLVVMGYIDVLRHIIGRDYWDGLRVVPIVMAAEILMGVYFNLSFWYKLIDRTIWGAWFSGIGCVVLIAVNVIFVPQYGYMACAWAGFAGYGTAMILSYFVGQKYYPINYPLKSIGVYVAITLLFFVVMHLAEVYVPNMALRLAINTACIVLFVAHTIHYDFPLYNLPVVGKYFRK